MDQMSPRDYELPHDTWYPNQESAVMWALERKKAAIVEAPTGSGKTGIARAQASAFKTIALVRTKFLQQSNYEEGYGFTPLYGRGNYPCVHGDARMHAMADECIFGERSMRLCPEYKSCPYCVQRDLARSARATTLNYSYWFHVYNNWEPVPEVLVCDEAHQLPDLTIDHAGCSFSEKDREYLGLPSFPIISNRGNMSILNRSSMTPHQRALKWLQGASSIVRNAYNFASASADASPEARRQARKLEIAGSKIQSTIDAMSMTPDGWYIVAGKDALGPGKWGFQVKPLTARFHFPKYFQQEKSRLLIMSATIGNEKVFAAELGLADYDFLRIPNVWPASSRQIRALDVPRLGRKSPESAYEKQADSIADAIKGVDNRWSGIIHVTSIMEASRLAKRLHNRGLHDRIHVLERAPTNQMVSRWQNQLARKPNSILVSWALWEGYDGTEEKINIVAKTPYPYLGDPYEKERQRFDGKFFLQRAAWTMEQGLGRTRRGRAEDYDSDGEVRGLVAIADGGWKWIRSYLSNSTREAVVE